MIFITCCQVPSRDISGMNLSSARRSENPAPKQAPTVVPSICAGTGHPMARNHSGNCDPTFLTVRVYRTLQLDVFVFSPFTPTSTRPVNSRIKDIAPSVVTLDFRSTRDERSSCDPILVTMHSYRSLQLDNFVFPPLPVHSLDRLILGSTKRGHL
jgi:hypothetical protein